MKKRTTPRRIRQALAKARIYARRDVTYRVGEIDLDLPPEHLLPEFQRGFPLYDRYFLPFLELLATRPEDLCVYDIGANVGDTAAAILGASQDAHVVCVEGSDYFLPYLRRNLAGRENVTLIEGFVTHRAGSWKLVSQGGTGRLVEIDAPAVTHLSASDVLQAGNPDALSIWKSDTDGFDIPILLHSFDEIVAACEVIWIEFDPLISTTAGDDARALLDRFAVLDRDLVVFDNFGHRMLRVPCAQSALVSQLVHWLEIQADGGAMRVNYFDVWVLPSDLADLM